MNKAVELWELSMTAVPPLKGIASIKIFLWQVPEFGQFIGRSAPALESGSEIFLR